MKLITSQFGEIAFAEEQMVEFPGGLLGRGPGTHFIVLDDQRSTPFQWLVCVEQPECVISVLDPTLVLNESCGPDTPGNSTKTFVVATPGSDDVGWWLDLRHPILINTEERTGEQVTLDDTGLPEKLPVKIEHSHETAE
jgi:flagellar assembly factor FliW